MEKLALLPLIAHLEEYAASEAADFLDDQTSADLHLNLLQDIAQSIDAYVRSINETLAQSYIDRRLPQMTRLIRKKIDNLPDSQPQPLMAPAMEVIEPALAALEKDEAENPEAPTEVDLLLETTWEDAEEFDLDNELLAVRQACTSMRKRIDKLIGENPYLSQPIRELIGEETPEG